MTFYRTFLSGCLAALFVASMAQGDIIVDSAISDAYSYTYTLYNQSDQDVLAFSLAVSGELLDIQAPFGWLFGTDNSIPGSTLVIWISTESLFDIPAFSWMSGFVVASTAPPGTVAFSTLDASFGAYEGFTIGPVASTPAPEPDTLWLLLGIVTLTAILRLKRHSPNWLRD